MTVHASRVRVVSSMSHGRRHEGNKERLGNLRRNRFFAQGNLVYRKIPYTGKSLIQGNPLSREIPYKGKSLVRGNPLLLQAGWATVCRLAHSRCPPARRWTESLRASVLLNSEYCTNVMFVCLLFMYLLILFLALDSLTSLRKEHARRSHAAKHNDVGVCNEQQRAAS